MPKGQYDRTKAKRRAPQREDIITAAMRVYAHHGFEGATVSRMAAEAGVSSALIHRHFGDKQGLVRAVAARSVEENLLRIGEIDRIPGLRLREREHLVFCNYKKYRDEWRLIYGTLLVPSFQFELRPVIENYLEEEYQNILRYQEEFQDPVAESVRAFTYTMLGLRQQYVLDGKEEAFLSSQHKIFTQFLIPNESDERKK